MGDRTLLGTDRHVGTIIEWKGKFGWIQPTERVDHPMAGKRGGKVYLSVSDVEEELEGVGAAVSFLVYEDPSGLGAMAVRPADELEQQCVAAAPQPQGLNQHGQTGGGCGKKAGKGGKGAMTAMGAMGGTKGGWGAQAAGDGCWGAQGYGPVAGAQKGNGWAGGCSPYGGSRPNQRPPPAADPKDVPERLHNALNNGVWHACKQLTQKDPEWNENEMTKRIVKYFYKAGQSPDLLSMPWLDAVHQFIESAMHGYSAACGDRPWFFELDLSQALCAGIWEVVRANSCFPRANYPEMEQAATARYEELMDGILTEKAMWDAAQTIFGDEPVSNKVYKALKASHEAAFTEACANPRPIPDQQRVEIFMGVWMESSMGRAWQAIENSEMLLSPDTITGLFSYLVAPFGEEHPFSCVPAALTQNTGRPPSGWPFIWQNAQYLFNSWLEPSFGASTKKKKSGGGKKWKQQPDEDAIGAFLQSAEDGVGSMAGLQ